MLITKCTYNTEDRSRPTVVSSTLPLAHTRHYSCFAGVHLECCVQQNNTALSIPLLPCTFKHTGAPSFSHLSPLQPLFALYLHLLSPTSLSPQGGFGIMDEMCVDYVHYYPRTQLELCKSHVDAGYLQKYFNFINRWHTHKQTRSLFRPLLGPPVLPSLSVGF